MVRGVETDIQVVMEVVNGIRKELAEPAFPLSAHKPGSVALLKALRKDLARLKDAKDLLMEKQLREHDALARLCTRLNEEPPLFEGVEEVVLPKAQVDEIARLRAEKQALCEERLNQLIDLQAKTNK